MNDAIAIGLYLLLAPIIGGLFSGFDRIITARMQGRKGPPLLQPFYDVRKLLAKQVVLVNNVQDFLVYGFLVFIVFTGCLFFSGGDILLVFFALTLAAIFFMMSACSANSPYSNMGAQRELLQMMAYEPMVLIVAIGFYMSTGTFSVQGIMNQDVPAILRLPGVFIGFLFILVIKFRKSPFDLSTSHHAHQEMCKGLTTEISGNILGFVEITHWYENVFLMGVVGLFFIYADRWSVLIAIAVCIAAYFLIVLTDIVFPRIKWQLMLKVTWIVTLATGVLNLIILSAIK